MNIRIGNIAVGPDCPTYFIADIAANHDGDIDRAINLIRLAAKAGANAAKFQNFSAETIVSDKGFRELGEQIGHQSKWTKSVFEVYQSASIPLDWTPRLQLACDEEGIDYFSAAYDFEALNFLDGFVPAYKIGSGDITWHEIVEATALKGKPVLLATGASTFSEVDDAVKMILKHNSELVLMQCNTNYTGAKENIRFQNLRVLQAFAAAYPKVVLGLSDHTSGHVAVLGAVSLGARVIEKHFTDDSSRPGPDHAFSMNPQEWRAMVEDTRDLEAALGTGVKILEGNEVESVVVQRRAVRTTKFLKKGVVIARDDLSVLRPAPSGSIMASEVGELVGKVVSRDLEESQLVTPEDFL